MFGKVKVTNSIFDVDMNDTTGIQCRIAFLNQTNRIAGKQEWGRRSVFLSSSSVKMQAAATVEGA